MQTSRISNMLLTLGIVSLFLFGLFQLLGIGADPLIPASAAFFIGCTAVLDRVGTRQLN